MHARSGILSERLVWRDIVVEGPVPSVAHTPLAGRAAYLAERLGIDAAEYARATAEQTSRLAATCRDDEVVLWFEQDLFCAVTLWSLLDWFRRHAPPPRLSLVYPASDADHRGLDALGPSRLAELFAARATVTFSRTTLGSGVNAVQ